MEKNQTRLQTWQMRCVTAVLCLGKLTGLLNCKNVNLQVIEHSQVISSKEECDAKYANFTNTSGAIYCNNTYDESVCWKPTEAGRMIYHSVPAKIGETPHYLFKSCETTGQWMVQNEKYSAATCKPEEMEQIYGDILNDEDDAQRKFAIANFVRYFEIGGLASSVICLMIPILIIHYKKLSGTGTTIQKNMLVSQILQNFILLSIHIDQIARADHRSDEFMVRYGIQNTPYLPEVSYVLLEYTSTAGFMWTCAQGKYLQSMLKSTALSKKTIRWQYFLIGWMLPLMFTGIWIATSLYYQKQNIQTCWMNYKYSVPYWISQGPKIFMILINVYFLIDNLRILFFTSEGTQNTRLHKLKKAIYSPLILLPLTGLTKIMEIFQAPLDRSIGIFSAWISIKMFLRSWHGVFVAIISTFNNEDVMQELKKICSRKKKTTLYNNSELHGCLVEPCQPHNSPDNKVHSQVFVVAKNMYSDEDKAHKEFDTVPEDDAFLPAIDGDEQADIKTTAIIHKI